MTERGSTDVRPKPKVKHIARRIFELITAAALLLAILYWPTTNTGRVILIGAGVLWFVGLIVLSKWSSV